MKTDFNLIDAFRIFDPEGTGHTGLEELQSGLYDIGLNVTLEELTLVMKRFDKDQDRKLRYSEFCDAFLPVDSFHASLLAKKAPLTMYPISALPKSQIFYPETCDMFINTFSLHIKNEIEAEKLRIDTQRKAGYSAHEAFSILDSNGDQFIDKEDLRQYFVRHCLYVPDKELCSLIERYDRTRDGKISY